MPSKELPWCLCKTYLGPLAQYQFIFPKSGMYHAETLFDSDYVAFVLGFEISPKNDSFTPGSKTQTGIDPLTPLAIVNRHGNEIRLINTGRNSFIFGSPNPCGWPIPG